MKKLITRCLTLLAATCGLGAWAGTSYSTDTVAVGTVITYDDIPTEEIASGNNGTWGGWTLTIPATDDLPKGSTVTLQSITILNRNNNAATFACFAVGSASDASLGSTNVEAIANWFSTETARKYTYNDLELTVGTTYNCYPLNTAGGGNTGNTMGARCITQTSDNTVLDYSNDSWAPVYEIVVTVKSIKGFTKYTTSISTDTAWSSLTWTDEDGTEASLPESLSDCELVINGTGAVTGYNVTPGKVTLADGITLDVTSATSYDTITGGTLMLDATTTSISDAAAALLTSSNKKFIVKGSGDNGATASYTGSSAITTHVDFVGGTHSMTLTGNAQNYTVCNNSSNDDPMWTIENDTLVNFTGHDVGGWNNTDKAKTCVTEIKDGGKLKLLGTSGTFYYGGRFLIDAGGTLALGNQMTGSNQGLRIHGGTTEGQEQFYVPDYDEAPTSSAKFTDESTNGSVVQTGNDTTAGVGIYVGKNATLDWAAPISKQLNGSSSAIVKRGAGTLNITGSTTAYGGAFTVAAGAVKLSSTNTVNATFTVNSGATLAVNPGDGNDVVLPTYSGDGTLEIASGNWSAGTLRDFGAYTIDSGVVVTIDETGAEYGTAADIKVTNVPDGVTVKVARIDGTTVEMTVSEGTATYTKTGESATINGAAALYDMTFTNTLAAAIGSRKSVTAAYDSITGETFSGDTGYSDSNGSAGILIKWHPYIDAQASTFAALSDFSVVVVGTMSSVNGTQFVHLGSSSGSNNGLLIANGSSANSVVIGTNAGATVTPLTTVNVPNASTARHVYAITKTGDVFKVYVDGVLKKAVEVTGFAFATGHGGVQCGSDFGGSIKNASGTAYPAAGTSDTGVLNKLAVYDYVLNSTQLQMFNTEYPYVSEGGLYTRTIDADAELSAESTWTKSGEETAAYAIPTGTDTADPSATITVDAEATVTVNADLSVETLTVGGTAAVTFQCDDDGHAITPTGTAIFNTTTTIKWGAVDVHATPVVVAEGATLTVELGAMQSYVLNKGLYVTQNVDLTGVTDADADIKFTGTPSLEGAPGTFGTPKYDETLQQWILPYTTDHDAGADIYYVSGYWSDAEGNTITVQNAKGDTCSIFPGDTVVIGDACTAQNDKAWVAATVPTNLTKIRVAKDFTFEAGVTDAIFDGVAITVDTGVSLTLTSDNRVTTLGNTTISGGTVKIAGSQGVVKSSGTISSTVTTDEEDKAVRVTTESGVTSYTLVPDEVTVTITPVTGMTIDSVKIGEEEQTANEDGTYTIAFGASLTVSYTVNEGYMGTDQTKTVTIDGDTTQTIDTSSITAPGLIVAKVGDETFTSLSAAVTAASNETDVVTLVADWSGYLSSGATVNSLVLNATWTISNGYSSQSQAYTIKSLSGTGTIANTWTTGSVGQYFTIEAVDNFTGKITGHTELVTLPTGYKFDDDGYIVACYYVAQIGETKYESLAEAITVGGKVELLADVTLDAPITIAKDVELVGGEYTVTGATGKKVFFVDGGVTLTITSGKIVSSNAAIMASEGSDGAKVVVNGGTIESVEGAICTGLSKNMSITVNGGTLSASDNAIIASNGSEGYGPATLSITGGTFNGGIVSSGYVACGVYWPMSGTVTISGGTFNITGGCGVLARAGSVSITGGTITTTGTAVGKVGDSRVVVPCAAVVFDQEAAYPSYDAETSAISVTGGTLSSEVATVQMVGTASITVGSGVTGATAAEGYKFDDNGKLVAVTGPSVDGDGTIEEAGELGGAADYIVTPAENQTSVTVSNLPEGKTVAVPASVETVKGVPSTQLVIAYNGTAITGAFTLTGDETDGIAIALDKTGSVLINGEKIAVDPEFTDGDDAATEAADGVVEVKAIPGLKYGLVGGATLAGDAAFATTVVEPALATSITVKLTDTARSTRGSAFFYRVKVTK